MDGMDNLWTSALSHRDTMDDCPCLIPDENDNCIDCGKHIELPDVGEPPNLGDIAGICKLLDQTAHAYARVIRDNADPNDPNQPRLRFVGSKLIRLPHKALLVNLLKPTFKEAKALGYRGTIERWGELVQERTFLSPPSNP